MHMSGQRQYLLTTYCAGSIGLQLILSSLCAVSTVFGFTLPSPRRRTMLARLRPRLATALRPLPVAARARHPLQPPALASCRRLCLYVDGERARPRGRPTRDAGRYDPERPVERRKGPDGLWYSQRDFGPGWDSAEVERRHDVDGKLYTLAEFLSFYAAAEGEDGAYMRWQDARHWLPRLNREIKAAKRIDSLLALHRDYYDSLDHIHLATLWHRLGVIDERSQRLKRSPAELDALREHTLAMMPRFGAQALSNISVSLARAGLYEVPWPGLWAALGAAAPSNR